MSTMTDVEQGITLQALDALGANRPGRNWLKENLPVWAEQAKIYRKEAQKLDAFCTKAQEILDQAKTTQTNGEGE